MSSSHELPCEMFISKQGVIVPFIPYRSVLERVAVSVFFKAQQGVVGMANVILGTQCNYLYSFCKNCPVKAGS